MDLIQKEEYYKIVGICMEMHRHLGGGQLEIVYKDALEYEFRKNSIPLEREKNISFIIKTLYYLINSMQTL